MVKRILHDDVGAVAAPVRWSADDGCPPDEVTVFPTLTVAVRTRTGFDGDGDPTYGWAPVVTGEAIAFEEPREVDATAGITVAAGRAMMLYTGDTPIDSTATVRSSFGPLYRVTLAVQVGDVLTLDLLTVRDPDVV